VSLPAGGPATGTPQSAPPGQAPLPLLDPDQITAGPTYTHDVDIPKAMTAVVLTGHGGTDRLEVRDDVAVPSPDPDQVLIRVSAAGVNNTDINTRTGWYSRDEEEAQTAWSGKPLTFPRIQGADCCGRIVAVGAHVDPARVGQRVVVRTMQEPDASGSPVTLGSEIDGAFAEYVVTRSTEAFSIDSPLDDTILGALPCSYSTAEGLLQRAGLRDERVLITGASGGVGSAAVMLARLRGAHITAVVGPGKADQVRALGADVILDRDSADLDDLPANTMDVVLDVVGGDSFPALLKALRPRGRYAVCGAVGGAHVDLDLRDLYLKDLSLLGATFHDRSVFADLVRHVESGALTPIVAATYPLADIATAQQTFSRHEHVGKLVLVPPTSPD